MDATLFTQMISDKKVTNLKKLEYKYPQANLQEFILSQSQEYSQPL